MPALSPPTMAVAPPGPAALGGPVTTVTAPPMAVPGAVAPAPMPGGVVQGGSFDVPIPAAAVSGEVVYLRLRIDMSSWSGDSTFTLGAAG